MSTMDVVDLKAAEGIGPREGRSLGMESNRRLVELLKGLSPDDWNKVTACDPWTVKDIAAHLLGWNEALGSLREMRSQTVRGIRRRKEFGNPTDAQNQIQVEDRRALTPDEIVARFEAAFPKGVKTRRVLGTGLRYMPIYTAYLGGLTNIGYVANVIFVRDVLIHRLDISGATGADPLLGDGDRRVMLDMVKDWARRSKADVHLELTGPLGGSFVASSGRAGSISADVVDFVNLLAGRADASVARAEGDESAVGAWLSIPCPV